MWQKFVSSASCETDQAAFPSRCITSYMTCDDDNGDVGDDDDADVDDDGDVEDDADDDFADDYEDDAAGDVVEDDADDDDAFADDDDAFADDDDIAFPPHATTVPSLFTNTVQYSPSQPFHIQHLLVGLGYRLVYRFSIEKTVENPNANS